MISNRIKIYQVFVFSLIIFLFSINVKAEYYKRGVQYGYK